MNFKFICGLVFMFAVLVMSACNKAGTVRTATREPDTLQVKADGSVVFNDRTLPAEDVFIYPDGFGGEKAAVKIYTPHHRPFYRDHIVVERDEAAQQ